MFMHFCIIIYVYVVQMSVCVKKLGTNYIILFLELCHNRVHSIQRVMCVCSIWFGTAILY